MNRKCSRTTTLERASYRVEEGLVTRALIPPAWSVALSRYKKNPRGFNFPHSHKATKYGTEISVTMIKQDVDGQKEKETILAKSEKN